ncbi:MAG: hypothetical protein HFF17_10805 [Oscillospiraceae bacterium]|nr:hypothetical protein [Oscillospiraceae bacterium]
MECGKKRRSLLLSAALGCAALAGLAASILITRRVREVRLAARQAAWEAHIQEVLLEFDNIRRAEVVLSPSGDAAAVTLTVTADFTSATEDAIRELIQHAASIPEERVTLTVMA